MLPIDLIQRLIQNATSAPSSHNTQPWLFHTSDSVIDLWADRTRALPVNDPFDRELTISCGAALFSLRVAAAAEGMATRTTLLPDGASPDWLARVEVSDVQPDNSLAPLAKFLAQRRTYRKTFAPQPIAADALNTLTDAVSREGGMLIALDEKSRHAAGKLIAEGDRMQWDNAHWRRELAMWMHPRRQGDGLALPALAAPIARAVTRSFDMGERFGTKDQHLAEASPVLTVLSTEYDDSLSWLRAGQALQRSLLVGCSLGLQASYLNQPIQMASLRADLRALTGNSAFPQLLLRWGHPSEELPAAPRRLVDEVLIPDHPLEHGA